MAAHVQRGREEIRGAEGQEVGRPWVTVQRGQPMLVSVEFADLSLSPEEWGFVLDAVVDAVEEEMEEPEVMN